MLKYLWNTKDQWLVYEESDLKSKKYWFQFLVGSKWQSCVRLWFYPKRGATCWKDSMQYSVASFICDMEFFTTFDTGKEVV